MMGACDAVLFTSQNEGFLIPIMEAVLHGKPIFAPRFATLSSWATEYASLYPPQLPSEEIATLISAFLERTNLKIRCRIRLQNSWDMIFLNYFCPIVESAR
jgi:hypothetical protein